MQNIELMTYRASFESISAVRNVITYGVVMQSASCSQHKHYSQIEKGKNYNSQELLQPKTVGFGKRKSNTEARN